MITVSFYVKKEPVGFEVSGHSGYADEGSDIICSAVSSCAYMTANTATEIMGLSPEIEVKDGYNKSEIANKLIENGLLVLTAGPGMRLLPPLVITKEEMDQGLAIMEKALG